MPISSDFESYLGVPTTRGRMSKYRYKVLIDKVHTRLRNWQLKSLSAAGHVTLANSILTSLPLYVMQATLVPRSICDEGSTGKIHLLSWDKNQKTSCDGLGVRFMRLSNSALLAKLGWRMLNNPSSLWSQVFREKCCASRLDLDVFRKHKNQSHIERHRAKVLSKGHCMSICNGRNTLFWLHPCLTHQHLIDHAILPLEDIESCAPVAELWGDNSLNWSAVSHLLLGDILACLSSIRVIDLDEASDKIYWMPLPRSGIKVTDSEVDPIWAKIWKVPTQQRARHFLFLVAHDVILCNANRARQHMSPSPDFPRCHLSETCLHLLCDCLAVKKIWLSLRGCRELYLGE
ncbi:LOW QUALITY PROTEIN: hypothetical protein V2J09_003717 [Rumex salicifolius]